MHELWLNVISKQRGLLFKLKENLPQILFVWAGHSLTQPMKKSPGIYVCLVEALPCCTCDTAKSKHHAIREKTKVYFFSLPVESLALAVPLTFLALFLRSFRCFREDLGASAKLCCSIVREGKSNEQVLALTDIWVRIFWQHPRNRKSDQNQCYDLLQKRCGSQTQTHFPSLFCTTWPASLVLRFEKDWHDRGE